VNVHLYKTEAIVLDRKDFGEADRLLTLYTPGMGKVRAIAKGSRRTTSRLSGHIELFTHTYLFLAQGRNLDIVTQSQLIHSHERLREDLWRAALGFHVMELVNHFSEERLDSPAVWHALLGVLRCLDDPGIGNWELGIESPTAETRYSELAIAESKAEYDAGSSPAHPIPNSQFPILELAVRYFEAQLLDHMGYRPELRDCTLCRERLRPIENYFHPPSGGVLCPHCAAGHNGLQPLSVDAIKVLRLLQDGEFSLASRLRLMGSVLREMETAMRRHISHVLERDLRTVHLVDEVRALG
jgi:DNA repair protein RecO (recombination protein O)